MFDAYIDATVCCFFPGILAPLIVMTKPVDWVYPDGTTTSVCELTMDPHVKKLYFTTMGMLFYGITAIVSVIFLACTICKIKNVDLESYFIKDDFKNHVSKHKGQNFNDSRKMFKTFANDIC